MKTLAQLKSEKAPLPYGEGYNAFILDAVPPTARRVLDVGCADGSLGTALRAKLPGAFLAGIEYDHPNAVKAARVFDRLVEGDVENLELDFDERSFDAILYGDVLEHLRDPLTMLRYHRQFLRDDGLIVTSIPNLRNMLVIDGLIDGRFTYGRWGILDETHLHLFTRAEIETLMRNAGLEIVHIGNAVKGIEFFLRSFGDGYFRDQSLRGYALIYARLKTPEGQQAAAEFIRMKYQISCSAQEAIDFFTIQFLVIAKKTEAKF